MVLPQQVWAQLPDSLVVNSSTTYNVPAGITRIQVQLWGGGGAGRTGATNTNAGGGGGGGAYARGALNVKVGQSYTLTVGAGGTTGGGSPGNTTFSNANFTFQANAGANTDLTTGGAGGAATSSFPSAFISGTTASFAGGTGGNGVTNGGNRGGGGGGGSAFRNAIGGSGQNGSGSTPGNGGTGTGAGGNAVAGSGTAQNGLAPGGGGGGSGSGGGAGNGASGRIIIRYLRMIDTGLTNFNLNRSSVPANGVNSAVLEINVKDNANEAVTTLVSGDFQFTGGNAVVTYNASTSVPASGIYRFNVTNSTVENIAISIQILGLSIGSTSTINFTPPPSLANSTKSLTSTSVIANNVSFTTFSMTVRNSLNQTMSSLVLADFQFTNIGSATIYDFTNLGNGQYSFKIRNATAQTINPSISVDEISFGTTGNIVFTTPTPSQSTSIVSAIPTSVLANGFSSSTLTVTVRDADNVPMTSLNNGNFSFSGQSSAFVSDFSNTGSGVYTFSVKSNTVETVNITVTVSTVNIGNTGNISFIAILPSASNSDVDVDLTSIKANGIEEILLTATVKDGSNQPITDVLLNEFEFNNKGSATVTNFNNAGSGVYTFKIKNTVAQTVNIQVSVRTINIGSTGNLTFNPQLPDVSNSSVSANPTSVSADGIASSTITLEIKDEDENPINDIQMSEIDLTGAGDAIINDFTNVGNGVYTLRARNTTQETINIGVTVRDVFIDNTGNITFSLATPSASNSSVIADPLLLLANGIEELLFTISVRDINNDPISDLAAVDFDFLNSGGLQQESFTNQGSGNYQFIFTNTTVEVLNIDVEVRDVVIGSSGSINFVAVPDASLSSVDVNTSSATADASEIIVMTLTIRDEFNQPINNITQANFIFSGQSRATIFGFNNVGGGVYTFNVANATIENVTIAAIVRGVNIGNTGQLSFQSFPFPSPSIYTGSGSFVVPNGVSRIKVQTWGGGGGGGDSNAGGGGGGGGYAEAIVSVTAGNEFTLTVGSGGTPTNAGGNTTFQGHGYVFSALGGGGASNANQNGGAAGAQTTTFTGSGYISTLSYAGGAGGSGAGGGNTNTRGGGGGGGSGFTTGIGQAGGAGSSNLGGSGGEGEGPGGIGGVGPSPGVSGNEPGGGGGGTATGTPGSGAVGRVIITYQQVNADNTFATRNPAIVVANGVSASVLTITVRDQNNDPITYLQSSDFVFNNKGSAVVGSFNNTGSGVYTFEVTNDEIETINMDIVIRNVNTGQSGTIQFISAFPNAGFSTISPSSTLALANGSDFITLSITVKDGANNAVLSLEESDFEFANIGATVISNFSDEGSGLYTFELTNATVQNVTISVTVLGIGLGNTSSLSFVVPPSVANSEISMDKTTIFANGIDYGLLTITVRDNSNNGITGLSAGNFSITGLSQAYINNFTVVGGGVYRYRVYNTVQESVTLTVTVNTVQLGTTNQLNFLLFPSASNSSIDIDKTILAADGIDTAVLTVGVFDSSNDPIVDLVSGDFNFSGQGNASITGFSNQNNGFYTFNVTNSTSQIVTIEATVRTVILGATDQVEFFASKTLYSYQSGSWQNANTWTQDPSGTTLLNPTIPGTEDNVVILNGREVILDANVTRQNLSLNIQSGGTLDLSTYTIPTLVNFQGSGTLRSANVVTGSPNVAFYPQSTTNTFNSQSGGTVVFYQNGTVELPSHVSGYRNLNIRNSTSNSNTFVIGSDIHVYEDLNIQNQSTGDISVFIGNSTTSRELIIGGDLTIDDDAILGVGNFNSMHNVELHGNLINNGSLFLQYNDTPQFDNNSPSVGRSTLTFKGATNTVIEANGPTRFYRLVVDKGSGRNATLSVNSSNSSNFSILGRNNQTISVGNNENSDKALFIKNGTIILNDNVSILSLTSGGSDFVINETSGLWINGADVLSTNVTSSNTGITVYGLLKISDGSLNTADSGGISFAGESVIEISGGTVEISQLKPSSVAGTHTVSLTISDGDLIVNGEGSSNTDYSRFSLSSAENVLNISGGQIQVSNPVNRSAGALEIGISLANQSVTGGTWTIEAPDGAQNASISSTVPFYHLITQKSGTGSGDVRFESPLEILSQLTIESGTFQAIGSNNLTIRGAMQLSNGATYYTNTNSTIFTGSNGQSLVYDGTIGNNGLYNLTVNKSAGTLTISGSETNLQVRNNFSVTGNLNIGDKVVEINGDATFSGVVSGDGEIILNPTGTTSINGNGSGSVVNLSLSGFSNDITFNLNSNLTINGELAFIADAANKRVLSIAGNSLQLSQNASISGFNADRYIATNGQTSSSGVIKAFDDELDFIIPVGVGTRYTPITIDFSEAPDVWGSITFKPIADFHPAIEDENYALEYYWSLTSSGFTLGNATVDLSFKYDPLDLGSSVDPENLIPAVFRSTWILGSTDKVDEINSLISFEGETTITGSYTTGDNSGSPFGELTKYYSRATGSWFDPNTWSNTSHAGAPSSTIPDFGSEVIIAIGHTVTVDANNASSSFIQINSSGTLDVGSTTGHNFGVMQGATFGTLRIGSSVFPGGDFTPLLNQGTVVYYHISSDYTIPTSSISKPSIVSYHHLIFEVLSSESNPFIAFPDAAISVSGNLNIYGNSTNHQVRFGNGSNSELSVAGNLIVNSGSLRFRFDGNGNRNLNVTGNITIAESASISNIGSTDMTHEIILSGNLTNNGEINLGASSARHIKLTFTGAANRIYSGNGSNTLTVIEIDKGDSQGSKLTVSNSGTFNINDSGVILTNGTLELNRGGTFVLSNTASAFSIPSTASLLVNHEDAIIRIGYVDDNAADLSLFGKLEITEGLVEIGNPANNSANDIVYASTGAPEINLTGGVLKVNGQIRRSSSSVNGSLRFRLSGNGEVLINGKSQLTTRGMLEVLNTGSVFEMSGTSRIQIVRGGSINFADLLLNPASATVTGGTIEFHPIGAGDQSFTLNTTTTLYNVSILSDATNNPTVALNTNGLTLNNHLFVDTDAVFQTSGLQLTIGGNFTLNENGTLTTGSNTVTLNGSNSILSGDFSSSPFNNLTLSSNANITLSEDSEIRINGLLTISSSASLNEDSGGNIIDLRGNVVNNGTHLSPSNSSTTGLQFNGSSQQTLTGTGVYGNVIVNNSTGLAIQNNITINRRLVLNSGGISLTSHQLTLGVDAEVTEFNASRMITTNGVLSDGGVRKLYPTGAYNFTFPVGVGSKYTPVSMNVSANTATGDITIKPVNVKHPSTRLIADQQLNYYWNVTRNGFADYTITHIYNYLQTDVTGDENSYRTGRFISANWTPNGGYTGTVDVSNNTMTLTDVTFINGDYTAGTEGEFGGVDILYTRNGVCDAPTGCNWNDINSWSTEGHAGPSALVFPNGVPAVINTGHLVKSNGNNRSSESLTLTGTAILDLNNDSGHTFGLVTGTGTIRIRASASNQYVFPGGDYSSFTASNGGVVEFYGATNGTLPTQTTYNTVRFLDGSTRTQPDVNLVLNGSLELMSGVLSNSTFNRNITLHKNWINNASASAYVPGTGQLILAGTTAQVIGGDFSTNFATVVLNGSGLKSLSNNIRIQNGLTFTSGRLVLNDHTLTLNAGISITGLPGVNNMIVTNGNGNLRREVTANGTYLMPVGDTLGVAKYTPMSLQVTGSGYSSAYFEGRTRNMADPVCGGGNYLDRYWIVNFSGITGLGGTGSFMYQQSDVIGTESLITTLYRGLMDESCMVGPSANTSSNVLTLTYPSSSFLVTGGDNGDLQAPTQAATNIVFSNHTTTSVSVSWTSGNGTGRIVLVREGSSVNELPIDDDFYSANNNYSGNPEELGSGNFVIFAGSGNSVNVSGLSPTKRYYFEVIEYNSLGQKISYKVDQTLKGDTYTKADFNVVFTGNRGWRNLALPLQNTTYAQVFSTDKLITQGFTGSTYPSSSPNLLWYQETALGTDNQRWRQPGNITDNVVPGRGYLYYAFGYIEEDERYDDTNLDFPIEIDLVAFESATDEGTFTFNITNTDYESEDDTFASGWNLIGNPFARGLDWTASNGEWTRTGLSEAIYIWDASANSGDGAYLTFSNDIGDLPLGIIASGQSFWVKVIDEDPELSVNEAAAIGGGTYYGKVSAELNSRQNDNRPAIQLIISNNGRSHAAFVAFDDKASLGHDKLDAFYLQPLNDSYVSIFTRNKNNQPLSINFLPRRFNTTIEIPIEIGGFESGQSMSGFYELSVGSMSNIPDAWAIEILEKNSRERVIWKQPNTSQYQVNSNYNINNLGKTVSNISDEMTLINAGFELTYDVPLKITTPAPGVEIVNQVIQGSTRSKFVLRVNANGEFSDIPENFLLRQNYPNPFNPTTTIEFGLPIEENVRIDVFDVIGRRVTTLTNQVYGAGIHTLQFNASMLSSGTYIIRMQSGGFSDVRKMTLIK